MVPFCCWCNYATVGHIGMQIFNFVILSVITAPQNAPTPHISRTHLPIVLLFYWMSVNKPKCAQKSLNEHK